METQLLCIKMEEEFWNSDLKIIIEKINQSKSLEECLKNFKELTSKIKSNGLDENHLKKLINLYFNVKSTHPIKKSIQAFLNQIENSQNIVQLFSSELESRIIFSKSLELDESYHFVRCINEMSQNFSLAEYSIGLQAKNLLEFLSSIAQVYINELQKDSSPSYKNEMSHRLHNCFQAMNFCIKCQISHNNERSDDGIGNQLEKIARISLELLNQTDIVLLDTKNICAIIIVTNNTTVSSPRNDNHMILIHDEFENPMKRLCLIFGVITVQKTIDISTLEHFTKILKKIYALNSIENAIIYNVSKLFTLITWKILSQLKLIAFSPQLQSITRFILAISLINLEHCVESVRYLARDSLKNLVEIGMKVKCDDEIIINDIFSAIESISSISTKSIVINSIQSLIPINEILRRVPNFLITLVSTITVSKEHKMSCYECLSAKYYKENSFDEWYRLFIQPLIEKIKSNLYLSEETSLLKTLLLRCIKKNKNAIKMILSKSQELEVGLYLLCLNMAKMEGALDNIQQNDEKWRGVVKYSDIKRFMVNLNDCTRLAALQMIVETKKSTECFMKKEIECILYFFSMNINVQDPCTRQNILGMIKKIFIRLNSSIPFLRKKNDNMNLHNQLDMLKMLYEDSMKNLKKGANFSRRNLSLNILLNILITIREFFPSEISSLYQNKHYETLFNIFFDGFESNKEIALEIMQQLPESIIKASSKMSLEQLENLMSSIKPADSLTAAYLIQFALKFNMFNEFFDENEEENSKYPEVYKLMIFNESLIQNALRVGEKSLIIAAGSNPIYGILLCTRYVIKKLDLQNLKTCSLWQSFFCRLISICKRLSYVVSPIVNDSSPEGCIPKENFDIYSEDNDSNLDKIIEHTTPQMVLLCAWRSIREISLLLGDISLRAKLNDNQMMEIGNHFIDLLSNIKHRGAFEQAFAGFSSFAIALRKSDSVVLHNLPEKLLDNIIATISGETNENENNLMQIKNLCATRRSAGLPYIIQALLASEISIFQVKNFHFVMKNLIEFSRHGVQMETRIHSLNILRTLFRCKEFNDIIGEYISPALQNSLLGYGAESWAERNSSTLLFSALMIRIFGVQRNKNNDDINIKNKMSGRVFFLRYPELYEFFMSQLNEALVYIKNQRMNSKLYPLMLILNRLYTSISDNCESNLKLIDFITIVTMCSSCPEYQTRVLCTKFIANIISPCRLLPRIKKNIKILKENPNLIGNSKHAKILEIFHLIKTSSIDDSSLNEFIDILNEILNMLPCFERELICFGALIDALIEIFKKLYPYLPNEKIQMDKAINCFNFSNSAQFGYVLLQSKLVVIDILRENIDFVLSINASMNPCELREKLNCLILLLNIENSPLNIEDIAKEFEINPNICFFIHHLSRYSGEMLELKMKSNYNLINELKKISLTKNYSLASRSIEVLSRINIKFDENDFEEMISGLETKPDVMKKSILKYVCMCIKQENNSKIIDKTDWSFLSKLLSSSFLVKSEIIEILKQFVKNLHLIKSEHMLFTVIKCVIKLLIDDDFDVRRKVSSMVSELLELEEVFIGPYAQEIFIKFLFQNSIIDKDRVLGTIVILMYEEEMETNENEYGKFEDIAHEFQVFEKNESSSYRETFAMKKLFLPILKNMENSCVATQVCNDEMIKQFSAIFNVIDHPENLEKFEKFIKQIFVRI